MYEIFKLGGTVIRWLALILLLPSIALGQAFPERAKIYIPMLKEEIQKKWADMPNKPSLSSQVEQETCISLKHSKCWNPKAELKTPREYGFGFGQMTVTYNADKSVRFDTTADVRKLDKDLSEWKDEGLLDPRYQLRALIVYDRSIYNQIPSSVTNQTEKLAFMFASYNGGLGGTLKDRRLCASTKGCDQNKWFNNVALISYKSKIKPPGYGKSFYEINREYPQNILFVRISKYLPYFD